MYSRTNSLCLCLTATRSEIFISFMPAKKYLWNLSSRSLQERIEFAGNEEYQLNAEPESVREKSRTRNSSDVPAIPSCAIYRLMCSIVEVPSCPENLVKSGNLNFGG